MNQSILEADQLYTWSDTYAPPVAQTNFCRVASTTPTATAPPAAPRSSFAGLRRQPQMDYLPQDYQSQASECLANYHRLRKILDEVCAINHELLCRREASEPSL